jgi:hypothetical protein
MIHRAILGSLERFIAILIEHHAGAFPLWLAPVQVKMIPIASRHEGYAAKVAQRLREAGVRVEVDEGRETLNKKVRAAQLEGCATRWRWGIGRSRAGPWPFETGRGRRLAACPSKPSSAGASRRTRSGPWRPATSERSSGAPVGPVAD